MASEFLLLNNVFLIIVAIQGFLAQEKNSYHGMEYSDNQFKGQNNAADADNTVYPVVSSNEETKSVEKMSLQPEGVDSKDSTSQYSHSISGKRRKAGHQRRTDSGKVQAKNGRLPTKQNQRLGGAFDKTGDISKGNSKDESSNFAHKKGKFYLNKPSDVVNKSAMQGPGPIAIKLTDHPTKKPFFALHLRNNSSQLGVDELSNSANISSENDDLVSYDGRRKKVNKNIFKFHNGFRSKNGAFMNWDDMLLPIKQYGGEIKPLQKYSFKNHKDKSMKNIRGQAKYEGDKKRKYKSGKSESPDKMKENKHHLSNKGKEQYTNLTVINQSLKSAASKKFDIKTDSLHPSEERRLVEKEERLKMEDDKLAEENVEEDGALNLDRDISGDQYNPAELDKATHNENPREAPRKGIRSKIEHSDWLDQITFSPLPDFKVKKHKAQTHNGLGFLFRRNNKVSEKSSPVDAEDLGKSNSYIKKKLNLIKNKVLVKPRQVSDDESLDEAAAGIESDVALGDNNDVENKRDERDIKSKLARYNSKTPPDRSDFDGEADERSKGVDKDHRNYFRSKNREMIVDNGDYWKGDYYDYDSRLNEDEKSATAICDANKTERSTSSVATYAPTADFDFPLQSSKAYKQNATPPPQTMDTRETTATCINNSGFVRKSNSNSEDNYEMFLNGQLADNFVTEVHNKLKLSTKMSRELGYGNDTDETCDRCVELKPTNVPNVTVMRNSLNRCPRPSTSAERNCCAVPRPMMKFLNVLIYFEKENENNFYNKIQDDSSFIFTGDYPEPMPKVGSNAKVEDAFVESPFKDAVDDQHPRDDDHAGKADEGVSSDLFPNEKNVKGDTLAKTAEKVDTSQHANDDEKRHRRRYSKNKFDNFPDESLIKDNDRPTDFLSELGEPESDPLAVEPIFKMEAGKNDSPLQSPRKSWTEFSESHEKVQQENLRTLKEPRKNAFDRLHGRGHPQKYHRNKVPVISQNSYEINPVDAAPNILQDPNNLYGPPINTDRRLGPDGHPLNDKDFIYRHNKMEDQATDGKFKGYDLYNDNGEYSLYPDLGEGSASGKYKMVKRDVEKPAEYDEEPSVLLEVPVVEYDLY